MNILFIINNYEIFEVGGEKCDKKYISHLTSHFTHQFQFIEIINKIYNKLLLFKKLYDIVYKTI